MKNLAYILQYIFLLGISASASTVYAQPYLGEYTEIAEVRVYSDCKDSTIYYYAPHNLILATDAQGAPDVQLVSMRYVGTKKAGDPGVIRFRNILRFKLLIPSVSEIWLEQARIVLSEQTRDANAKIELRPLPISKAKASVIYTPLHGEETYLGELDSAGNGQSKTTEEAAWNERTFSLSLSNHDAQIFRKALTEELVILSIEYMFWSMGVLASDVDTLSVQGQLQDVMEDHLANILIDENAKNHNTGLYNTKTNTYSLLLDLKQWPNLIRTVDINDRLPPGYAAVDIYCYDFADALRLDLLIKSVEVEARSVSNKPVRIKASFSAKSPNKYKEMLQFPYAIRLDKPFRYRVIERATDGTITKTNWRIRTSWLDLLDVTSKVE